ncbi:MULTISPECIES: DUF333 domain-containing protein [unclassified Methanoregula]|uniref:DUF333 domain-containing protein n=1 Tax=unclassified Methanoregula TaxID=2649730 RepID=UPI0009D32516|nr:MULTISPECIES: DUF333 domain-containing protein [unclassified Methanoregula]OPX65391.1 MAG: hypothetical protein A4E33_00424 [Methanoregula sp. PtaB.Bin085]OPY32300.1 MAG: hypothetical protein A4E34_02674 [Methanoregula sp. PtaU1.Bin006]
MAPDAKIPAIIFLLLAALIAAPPAGAMINPSAGYCEALGYQYTVTVAADGGMTGFCVLPGNRSVDAWQFLEGKTAPEFSYCKKQGLEIRTVIDPDVCGMLGDTCAVCIKGDGSVQEVTRMMGIDFREKICSGNICCDPATDISCSFAQGTNGSTGTDGSGQKDWLSLAVIGIIVLLIIAAAAYFLMRKKIP